MDKWQPLCNVHVCVSDKRERGGERGGGDLKKRKKKIVVIFCGISSQLD
jgi:hypothetical protein